MPNVNPRTTTRPALANKFELADARCRANYNFYLGATNDNIEEIKALEVGESCGIKAFMGASTGDMLVDDPHALELLFEHAPVMVVTHCEHSPTIRDNEARAKSEFGEQVPMSEHPNIRSANACLLSSSQAVDLARRHDSLLHILHLTTAIEMGLFAKGPHSDKRITAEVCVHHLWFDDSRYEQLGTRIKCNPAIKTAKDREALLDAVNEDRIDIIATDHAPHDLTDKQADYHSACFGIVGLETALPLSLRLVEESVLTLPQLIEKLTSRPAEIFKLDQGTLGVGKQADVVIFDPDEEYKVEASRFKSKSKNSPFDGWSVKGRIQNTIYKGKVIFSN